MNSLFELLLIQELQDQENELSTERRHLKRPVLYTKCRNTTTCSPRSACNHNVFKEKWKKNPKTRPKLGIWFQITREIRFTFFRNKKKEEREWDISEKLTSCRKQWRDQTLSLTHTFSFWKRSRVFFIFFLSLDFLSPPSIL
jgi:hypothetical protein